MAIEIQSQDMKKALQENYKRLLAKYDRDFSEIEKMLYLEGFTDGVFFIGEVIS